MANKIIIKLLLCILGHLRMQLKLKERALGYELHMNNFVPEKETIEEAIEFLDK
jgi:hypothetical protein